MVVFDTFGHFWALLGSSRKPGDPRSGWAGGRVPNGKGPGNDGRETSIGGARARLRV